MQKKAHVYLESKAPGPLNDQVPDTMLPYSQHGIGTTSSFHRWGQTAETALTRSREIVSKPLGFSPANVIFPNSVMENNNRFLSDELSSCSLNVRIGHSKYDKPISELSTIPSSIIHVFVQSVNPNGTT